MDTTKLIQALAYLADKQPNKTIDNMKAYKLLWLADRYHLRRTGRTITGDSYYAMPHGIVPSDAKCLLEGEKTKLKSSRTYLNQFIFTDGNHEYKVIKQPDLKMFSDSDQDAIDIILKRYNKYNAKQLSELSHKFPEWLFYEDLLKDKSSKNSYKIDLDHFFEDAPKEAKTLFNENREMLELTKELYHQYNRI